MGQDRFNADLRPMLYRLAGLPETGLACHPYDIAGLLVAEEAGVVITDGMGSPLDAPMDTTSAVSWVGYANAALRSLIEPHVRSYLSAGR
jgi:fructose-1,6-bisphosphatase/inositol monophosphatase family enzyme